MSQNQIRLLQVSSAMVRLYRYATCLCKCKLQQLSDTGRLIRLHYLYEYGARCQFNQEFHKLWKKHFGNNPILCKEKTAIQLYNKTSPFIECSPGSDKNHSAWNSS